MKKCALIIDMNWLLISRASVRLKYFSKKQPEQVREANTEELREMLARSINLMLNRFPSIDNIVLIADGGSWRKKLTPPKVQSGLVYKGNRVFDDETDWNLIFGTLNGFLKYAQKQGVTVSQALDIEGDDWAWYWSRKLNAEGTSCILWTADQDLKQLVCSSNETNTFTAWYNDKMGLWLDDNQKPEEFDDSVDFFLTPIPTTHPIVESMKTRATGPESYIAPFEIVLEKIFMGDSGDNIKAVAQYTKNGKTFSFSKSDYKDLREKFMITDMDSLLKQRSEIAQFISEKKKFRPYGLSPSDIAEMIVFNARLVWLNARVIPADVQETMNTVSDYREFDVDYIRNSYRVLLDDKNTDYMQELFGGIEEEQNLFNN